MKRSLPLVVMCLAGCASAPPAPTSLYTAAAWFPGGTVSQMKAKLADACVAQGGRIINEEVVDFTCVQETPPVGSVNFHPSVRTEWLFGQHEAGVRVRGHSWTETDSFDGVKTANLTDAGTAASMQSTLVALGGQPVPTT